MGVMDEVQKKIGGARRRAQWNVLEFGGSDREKKRGKKRKKKKEMRYMCGGEKKRGKKRKKEGKVITIFSQYFYNKF